MKLLWVGLGSFVASVATFVLVVGIGEGVLDARRRDCARYGAEAHTPGSDTIMPGSALPLAWLSLGLMALAVVFGVLAARQGSPAGRWWRHAGVILAIVGVFGVLGVAYLGVHAVISETTNTVHCTGG